MEPTQPLQTTDGDTYKQNANHTKANKFKNNNFLSNLKTPYKTTYTKHPSNITITTIKIKKKRSEKTKHKNLKHFHAKLLRSKNPTHTIATIFAEL